MGKHLTVMFCPIELKDSLLATNCSRTISSRIFGIKSLVDVKLNQTEFHKFQYYNNKPACFRL